MLTKCAKAYSSSGSLVRPKIGVFTLKNKYQILYLDRTTIVQWRHLANDRLVSQPKIAKKSIKPPILAFKVIEFGANREPVYDFLLVINSNLGPISHSY